MIGRGAAVGPYRVLSPLGRGGMGVVFKARHTESSEVVALKTLEAPSDADLAAIRREMVALSRLRHPGIVRIAGHGVHEGLPWYAMELCPGQTLRERMNEEALAGDGLFATRALDSPTTALDPDTVHLERPTAPMAGTTSAFPARPALSPEALAAQLTIVRRLCAPLQYLHGEGIVHRDLKPENVLLRPDGLPVLLDFGLASVRADDALPARESLMGSGDLSGTLSYMSPEQCRGEAVDARSDLYALGCLLYELVARRPPFVAESPVQLLYLHLNTAPQSLSEAVGGVPPELADLVERLLCKDPRGRPGYASDVAEVLEKLGAEDGLAAAGPTPRPYVYRPALQGRDDVVRDLGQRLERLGASHGGIVLVGGESGVGKTRLLTEAMALARRRGRRVLAGDCPPPPAGRGAAPLAGLRRILLEIADGCHGHDASLVERLFGAHGPVLAAYEPSISALPGQGALPEPPPLPPEAARVRVWTSLARTLNAASLARPILVVVDDLQWADDLTSGFLAFMARGGAGAGARLMFLVTYRTEETTPAIQELLSCDGVTGIVLPRLQGGDVALVVADMLALPSPPAELVRHLAAQSEGNPLFVAEYLRSAIGEGLLVRDGLRGFVAPDGAMASIALPATLRELVTHRLAALPPEARRAAEAAAVLGREVDAALLARLLGEQDDEMAAALATLVARQVMEQDGRTLRFSHDKLRETAYDGMPASHRTALHAAAAAALEEAPECSGRAARLAMHWHQAGRPERARPRALQAAREAVADVALPEAERLYRLHREIGTATEPDDVDASLELAEHVLETRGRLADAQRAARAGLDGALGAGDAARTVRARRVLSHVVQAAGRPDEALALLEEGLAGARALHDATEEAMALRGIAAVRTNQGSMVEAQRLLEETVALAERTGNRRIADGARGDLGIVLHNTGHLDEAAGIQEELAARAAAEGDRRAEATALGNLASVERHRGRFARAEELYLRALEGYRAAGDRPSESKFLMNLAVLMQNSGRPRPARELYEEALAAAVEMGATRAEGSVLSNYATLDYEEGKLDDAEARFTRALELLGRVGDRRTEAYVLANMAMLEGRRGNLDEARLRCEAATALAHAAQDRLLEGELLGDLSSYLLRAGRLEAARETGERSLAIGRAVGNERGLGITLGQLARVARLERKLEHADALAAEAQSSLEALGDDLHLGVVLCERGLIAIDGGSAGGPWLERARTLHERLGADAQGALAQGIEELERAMEGRP